MALKLYDVIMWDPSGEDAHDMIAYRQGPIDFNNNSQLIVHESQEAIFFKDGRALDLFKAGKHKLTTDNLPLLTKLMNIPTGGVNQYHCEVFYTNLALLTDLSWDTDGPILLNDPVEDIGVHVRGFGTFKAQISDSRKFLINVVATKSEYTRKEYESYLKNNISTAINDAISQALTVNNIGVLQIAAHSHQIAESIKAFVAPKFDRIGVTVLDFEIGSIKPLEEDVKTLFEAKNQRRKREEELKAMDLESQVLAKKRQREGYTYQQERSFGVMEDAAKNEGTSSTFLGAGMGLGLGFGVGGAFGSGMAAVGQNLNVANGQQSTNNLCPNCNSPVPTGSKFCVNCGKPMESGKKVCPKCGAEITGNARFCSICGEKLIKVCKSCGQEFAPNSRFCPNCGTENN